MIFIECLFEWAGEFAGIIGVFIVLLPVRAIPHPGPITTPGVQNCSMP